MCCVLWCRLLGAGVCDRAALTKTAMMSRMQAMHCRQLEQAMICQSHGSGCTCFMSIRWMRAMDSENIGQQQPSRINPSIEPLH